MSTKLHEELDALADTQTFSPDPSAWDRGRRARRNSRVARGVASLAVVIVAVGAGALALQPDRGSIQPAEVPGGAIPSVVPEPGSEALTDLAIGRASVAYVDSDSAPVLVDATTGEAHRVELPDFPDAPAFDVYADYRNGTWLALSPDGTRLAYPTTVRLERDPGQFFAQTAWYRTVDLTTGKSELVEPPECGTTPGAMTWTPDGRIAIDVLGRPTFEVQNPGVVSCTVDPGSSDSGSKSLVGVTSPGGGISATFPGSDATVEDPQAGAAEVPVDAVGFVTSSGSELERSLPTDTYPDGATVRPIGWADDSLLVAQVGGDLVLLTSPDQPESEWVWRTLVSDAPDSLGGMSIAVDLVPDLTADPEQQLTHDFASAGDEVDNPLAPTGFELALLGGLGVAGVTALIAVFMSLRWLGRRRRSRRIS